MGMAILGAVVGMVTATIASGILVVVLAFVLGTGGIVQPGTYVPTTAWLVMLLVVSALGYYLGAAIGQIISKNNLAAYVFMGLIAVLSAVGAVRSSSLDTSKIPKPSDDMSVMTAMVWSQVNAPAWPKFVSPIVAIAAVGLGGLARKKPDQRIA